MIANNLVRAVAAPDRPPTPLGWPIKVSGLKEMLGFGSARLAALSFGLDRRAFARSHPRPCARDDGHRPLQPRRGARFHAHQLVTGAVGGVNHPAFARLRDEGPGTRALLRARGGRARRDRVAGDGADRGAGRADRARALWRRVGRRGTDPRARLRSRNSPSPRCR